VAASAEAPAKYTKMLSRQFPVAAPAANLQQPLSFTLKRRPMQRVGLDDFVGPAPPKPAMSKGQI
jgi:hypothetical protein